MPYPKYSLPEYPLDIDMWDILRGENRPIVVYGMGNGADKLIRRFDSLGIEIADFFASDGFCYRKIGAVNGIFHLGHTVSHNKQQRAHEERKPQKPYGTGIGNRLSDKKRYKRNCKAAENQQPGAFDIAFGLTFIHLHDSLFNNFSEEYL